MKRQGRVYLIRGIAVVMVIVLIGAMVSAKGMTAEVSGIRLTKSSLSLKVGETKTAISAGIRITYAACQKLLIIQMENTTKSAKSVSVETDLLDSKGKRLSGPSIFCLESISHLSAGQVYYTYAHSTDCCDVTEYVIQKLQVRQADSMEIDCLANIKVTSGSGMIEKNVGITELTYEYIGKDISKLHGKSVHIYGTVVYYDAEDNIVDFFNVRETIKLSNGNNKTIGRVFSLEDNIDHYEVILSGAEYSGDEYSYDGGEVTL